MDKTISTQTGTAHALLIGVDDYKSFDEAGCSDLQGSLNDVALLACYCVEVLGMRPENIVALTTPKMLPEDLAKIDNRDSLEKVCWDEAKEDQVKVRLASLLSLSKGGTALLAFSGHGAALPGGEPLLCLGDTAPGFKSGVLSLKTLGVQIKAAGAGDRLIAVLDCCHVEGRPTHRRLRAKALPSLATPEDVTRYASQEDPFRVSERVLLAAKPGKSAYQVRLGKWHGALTFALVTAADQWQGKDGVSHGGYKHVLERARRTLKALGVPQKAQLRVPEKGRAARRKQPFLGVIPGFTVKKPDAMRLSVQLDGGYRYLIQAQDALGNPPLDLATVVAVGTTSTPITLGGNTAWPATGTNAGAECWYVNPNNVGLLSSGSYSIKVSKLALTATESVPVMSSSTATSGFSGLRGALDTSSPYIMAQETVSSGWLRTAPTILGTAIYVKGVSATGSAMWMCWDVASGSLHQVIWFVITSIQPTTVQPTSYTPFSHQSSAPTGYYQASSINS